MVTGWGADNRQKPRWGLGRNKSTCGHSNDRKLLSVVGVKLQRVGRKIGGLNRGRKPAGAPVSRPRKKKGKKFPKAPTIGKDTQRTN